MQEALYSRDSVTWRINQEPMLLLGGGRALLMQLANPGVAAGVAEHSDFKTRPVRRLARTLELTLALTFGTTSEALAAARQINAVHRRVQGDGYSATDPRLLLWVHSTLIDSALVTYGTFVRQLSPETQETYYQEAKRIGGLLRLPNACYPPRFADFTDYLAATLASDDLRVDARALDLAEAVLRPPLRRVPRVAFRPLEAVTAGLLPERLRVDYRLRWGRAEQLAFRAARRGLSTFVGAVPNRLRMVPPARRAAIRSSTLRSLH